MEETKFYHALKIDNDRCVGCTHCMTKCPTGAIRIREGKASIRKGWCVDCGECLKACPTEAIYVEQDDFQKIFDYKARVVLVPTVFIGQFSKYTTEEEIFSALYELGFTHVFQVEFTADMIHREMLRQMELAEDKPVISSFCPAIVRLIQVRFPALVDNILLVKPPVNATATYYHKVLEEDGFSSEEIGIFYVTPCAAKIASLKGAEGYSSTIKGVINMDTLYNKVYHILKNRPKNYTPFCGEAGLDAEISGGYTSDLLSDVMGHIDEGMLWVTMQTHQNIVAVATLKDVAAVLIVNGASPDEETLEKGKEEDVPLLGTPLSAFEVTGKIYSLLQQA